MRVSPLPAECAGAVFSVRRYLYQRAPESFCEAAWLHGLHLSGRPPGQGIDIDLRKKSTSIAIQL
jgi:hypothetical protein